MLLDISPPLLVFIEVFRTLEFDRQDLNLQAHYIVVMGKEAALEVVAEEEPFQEFAVITMHGHARSKELPVYGANVIEGRLDQRGAHHAHSWTQLALTASVGATKSLCLMVSAIGEWVAKLVTPRAAVPQEGSAG